MSQMSKLFPGSVTRFLLPPGPSFQSEALLVLHEWVTLYPQSEMFALFTVPSEALLDGLPLNGAPVTLRRESQLVEHTGPVVPFMAGKTLEWRIDCR